MRSATPSMTSSSSAAIPAERRSKTTSNWLSYSQRCRSEAAHLERRHRPRRGAETRADAQALPPRRALKYSGRGCRTARSWASSTTQGTQRPSRTTSTFSTEPDCFAACRSTTPNSSGKWLSAHEWPTPPSATRMDGRYRDFLLTDPERKGHLVESAVRAFLLAQSKSRTSKVFSW